MLAHFLYYCLLYGVRFQRELFSFFTCLQYLILIVSNYIIIKIIGFLRSRRAKKKDKKKSKDDLDQDGIMGIPEGYYYIYFYCWIVIYLMISMLNFELDNRQVPGTAAVVDAEGFTVPPQASWENEKNNFYSSSDSDSGAISKPN